jgi:hypothetical protein
VGAENNYNDRQICVYKSTNETEKTNSSFDVPLYIWIGSLVVIFIGLCIIQCNIFGSRKHLYAENKDGYIRKNKDD